MRNIQKPPPKGRPLWTSLVGASTSFPTLSDLRIQHLITSHGVRPSLAETMAALAFSEGRNHG